MQKQYLSVRTTVTLAVGLGFLMYLCTTVPGAIVFGIFIGINAIIGDLLGINFLIVFLAAFLEMYLVFLLLVWWRHARIKMSPPAPR